MEWEIIEEPNLHQPQFPLPPCTMLYGVVMLFWKWQRCCYLLPFPAWSGTEGARIWQALLCHSLSPFCFRTKKGVHDKDFCLCKRGRGEGEKWIGGNLSAPHYQPMRYQSLPVLLLDKQVAEEQYTQLFFCCCLSIQISQLSWRWERMTQQKWNMSFQAVVRNISSILWYLMTSYKEFYSHILSKSIEWKKKIKNITDASCCFKLSGHYHTV